MLNIKRLEEIAKRCGVEVAYTEKGKGEIIPANFDGLFTNPTGENINMLALREYCKENNIKYEDLTDIEINKFKIN